MNHRTPAYVVADLGGTNIRLARLDERGRLLDERRYRNRDFHGLAQVLRAFLNEYRLRRVVLGLAVASPIRGDEVVMTNLDWRFSQSALKRELDLEELLVINDFTAQAMAITRLGGKDLRQVGRGSPRQGQPVAVCGPGTGLGVAHLIHHDGRPVVLSGEGGHVDFAPQDELEAQILHIFRRRYDHVSAERIISGPGLVELYRALCEIRGSDVQPLKASQISELARQGGNPLCREALERFCAMLGSFCGNLALTLGTFGGVYITGGIIPGILDFFSASDFRERFEAKGRYRDYNGGIPTYVVTAPSPGLLGAAACLRQAFPPGPA